MASILKIIKGTTSVSLWDATGFSVLVDGWSMAPAEDTPHIIQEQIRCKLITTGRDNAASQIQALNDLLRDATRYNKRDPLQTTPVYIETQLDGETNKRFALIAGKNAKFRSAPYNRSAVDSNIFREIILTIIREHPWRSHKPGLLPGHIQLTATDGPDYDPDESDFDVNLVSTFGEIPAIASGGLIGRPGQFGRGVQVAEAMTNLITNPSFEINTAGWASMGAGCTITRTEADAKYGIACMDIYAGSWGYGRGQTESPVDASTEYTVSGYFKAKTAADVGVNCLLSIIYDDSGESFVTFQLTDEWQYAEFTLASGPGDVSAIIACVFNNDTDQNMLVDAIQFEASAHPTSYCDGSLGPGHSWSGAVHASTSARVASRIDYDALVTPTSNWTVSVWWTPHSTADEADGYWRIFELRDAVPVDRLGLRYDNVNDRVQVHRLSGGADTYLTNAAAGDVALTRFSPYMFTITFDGTNMRFYQNAVLVDTLAASAFASTAMNVHLGHVNGGSQNQGIIDDFFILTRAMTTVEILAMYDSGKAFVGDPNLLLYLPFDGPHQVHIANFRDDAELTHIYNKIDGGAWSANLVAETEFTLFPNAVAEDDFVLFGSTDQPPKHVVLNLRTAGALTDTALVLHYWNGGWVDLVLGEDYTVYPGTTLKEMLESQGNIVINIKPPSDWAKADPGFGAAVYAFILKEQDATPVYATHPVHGGQLVYTARTNEIRIPAASLHGDAMPTALLRLLSPGGGDENEAFSSLSRIIWGIKSDNSVFTSNLNAGNADNPTGWAVTYGADASAGADPRAPGGAWADCDFGGDETLCKRVIFTGTNKLEYWLGAYGVYIKAQQVGGDNGDISLMLRTYIGSTNDYDPHMDTDTFAMKDTDLGLEAVDLGEINIPFAAKHSVDDFSDINLIFEIHASRKTGSAAVLEISELVLMPADEASGAPDDHAGDIAGGSFALRGNEAIDHDGGIIVRRTNKNAVSGIIHRAVMDWNSGGPFIEIKNFDVAARIYFMLLHYPAGGTWGTGPLIASPGCHLMGELQLHHRYKLLRGND